MIRCEHKLAICYHGPPRSLRQVYKNHIECVFNPLVEVGIEYEIFVHTWEIEGPQFIWSNPISAPTDHDAWELIHPDYFRKDIQSEFIDKVDMSNYFDEELWKREGDNRRGGEWPPTLIRNYLCSLESQKRVTSMIDDSFQCVMYIRPDAKFAYPIDCSDISMIEKGQIIIPNRKHGEGLNDKFSTMTLQVARTYGNRIDYLAEFRKTQGRIVSEKYTKYFIGKHKFHIVFSDINFNIIRPK